MPTRIRHLWEMLTTGYWFVPTLMIIAATVLAFVLLYIDRVVIGARIGWLYAGGSDGAKTMLSTIAGSVITVAGVVFSITIAALTQASSQFGPRLLRNFMRDTGNQIVLGTFVATFVYCLLVLRTIHGEFDETQTFVPQASVSAAVLLAAASIAVLIYFIHHVSISLQAPAVIDAVLKDLEEVIDRLPEAEAPVTTGSESQLPATLEADARKVRASKRGYLQAVDYDGLINRAQRSDLILRLAYRPGDYTVEGTPLLFVWPAASNAGEATDDFFNAAFICGRNASTEQDLEFAVRQMVEVAVRALSPGINDPFTAINCIDALGSAVTGIARRELPKVHRFDDDRRLRLVTPVTTFDGFVDTAFNQIRQYGRGSVSVMIRLLEVITVCIRETRTGEQRNSLSRHAEMVHEDGQDVVSRQARDHDDFRKRYEAATQAMTTAQADRPFVTRLAQYREDERS